MSNAWLFLGMSQFNLNEPAKALASLRQYTSMNPGDAQGHYYRGLSFLTLGRDEEAVQALLEARKIDPKNTDVLYHLAESYIQLAGVKGADLNSLQAEFQRTVGEIAAIDPNSIRLHQLQAGYYEATGDSKKAQSELEEMIKTHPHVQGVYYALGCFYLKGWHLEQALEQFKAELALDAPYPRTYLQVGRTYTDMREPEKALPFLEKAIRMEPGQATPWVQMGRTRLRMNEFDKAASALEKAIQLGDKSASTYFLLSNAYRGMGKLDLAQQAVKKSEEASREQSNKVIEHLREVVSEQKPDKK
jgi:tetratricopeptide (TPR) repeat protein